MKNYGGVTSNTKYSICVLLHPGLLLNMPPLKNTLHANFTPPYPRLFTLSISVSIEFFPNHNSCKVNSSLCTNKPVQSILQCMSCLIIRLAYFIYLPVAINALCLFTVCDAYASMFFC